MPFGASPKKAPKFDIPERIALRQSVLFKVTLLAYGYTFISRGTVQAFIEDLGHEAAPRCVRARVSGRY
ncbi:hypothetical protein PG994_015204 [Apiospora phragmitis]|uniref:Integrase n=1 Tax=Apiospora phragmitis TaxID=2905665 RepID=A0ABR1SQV3_9PEZI